MNRLFLLIFLVFISCNDKDNKKGEEQATETEEFKMYSMSEMALLMEQMYVSNEQLREKIINQDSLGEMPNFFSKISTASLTDKSERDAFFNEKQFQFLARQSLIYSTKDPKKAFNEMVDACISCHTVKCGGPIARIKKLYIQ